jgi:hypothetical protein
MRGRPYTGQGALLDRPHPLAGHAQAPSDGAERLTLRPRAQDLPFALRQPYEQRPQLLGADRLQHVLEVVVAHVVRDEVDSVDILGRPFGAHDVSDAIGAPGQLVGKLAKSRFAAKPS